MKYIDWQNNPIRFRAMTGYDVCEFNALLPYFQTAHDEYLSRYTLKGKPRSGQRSYVIYSGSPLACHAERLAFILSYMKLNPLQEQHADTFSMTQKQCNEFAHGLDKVLKQALQLAEDVPAGSNQGLLEILSTDVICEQNLLLHDGTESEVPRPVDNDMHAIGSVKRYRTVKDECRLRKDNFVYHVFLYCAALHNFRLKTSPFSYKTN